MPDRRHPLHRLGGALRRDRHALGDRHANDRIRQRSAVGIKDLPTATTAAPKASPSTASDPTGISQATLSVEEHVIATQAGVCDYTYTIPCQGLTGTLTLNTTQLADGPHTVTLAVYDAAGDEAQVTHQIVVDNTAPPAPTDLSALRAPDGSDTVSWADPAHVVPITQATYQLCPASGMRVSRHRPCPTSSA